MRELTLTDHLRIAQAEWNKVLDRRDAGREQGLIYLTNKNQLPNTPWGDSLEEKGDDVFRL
jgi:hypothetical protein